MKTFAITFLVGLALPSAVAAQHREPSVITQPDWVARPSGADLEDFYPKAAWGMELEGRASITCIVKVSGVLSGCSVSAESPPELGFGPAALRMATAFKMRPMTKDGTSMGGGHITIPIAFRIPPKAPAPAPPLKPVDAETLDLARRLVAADPSLAEHLQEGMVLPDDGVTPPQTRAAAAEALNAVIAAHRQDLLEMTARAVASTLSHDELQALANYMILGQQPQLPPGETAAQFKAKLDQIPSAVEQAIRPINNQYTAESRAIFCKTRVCAPGGTETAQPPSAAQARP